jgi:hypothetical protein
MSLIRLQVTRYCKVGHISTCLYLPVRVYPLNGQTVSFPVFWIFVFAVGPAAEDAALYSLGRQSSYVI